MRLWKNYGCCLQSSLSFSFSLCRISALWEKPAATRHAAERISQGLTRVETRWCTKRSRNSGGSESWDLENIHVKTANPAACAHRVALHSEGCWSHLTRAWLSYHILSYLNVCNHSYPCSPKWADTNESAPSQQDSPTSTRCDQTAALCCTFRGASRQPSLEDSDCCCRAELPRWQFSAGKRFTSHRWEEPRDGVLCNQKSTSWH